MLKQLIVIKKLTPLKILTLLLK